VPSALDLQQQQQQQQQQQLPEQGLPHLDPAKCVCSSQGWDLYPAIATEAKRSAQQVQPQQEPL